MEHLPIYIPAVFILTTLLTVVLLFKAGNYHRQLMSIVLLWLVAQAVIGLSGFYVVCSGIPPRFALLLIPPVVLIVILLLTKKGRQFINGFDVKTLTLIHVVRLPVELTLYWLFLHKAVPQIMTFEGRNFDILCGITAPVIYYFGYVKKVLPRSALLIWNIACLCLLANIVFTAILSAPFDFQKFGFEQPNIALFYFPFIWLPCFVVPAALLAHLIAISRLLKAENLDS